jgi:hypothetical protein
MFSFSIALQCVSMFMAFVFYQRRGVASPATRSAENVANVLEAFSVGVLITVLLLM